MALRPKCAAVEVSITCQQSKAPHFEEKREFLGKQLPHVYWDRDEVRSVWRRPKPCHAIYLADRIIVSRLFEYQFSKLIMHETPHQVALVWLAGKETDTRNEDINASAPPGAKWRAMASKHRRRPWESCK